ncbi:MAG: hypothetical protein LRY42_00435 [Candidatus Pacebacteria bacterium]|nr:hypothetical protein [Candidatus Paceibacterota bacterium]
MHTQHIIVLVFESGIGLAAHAEHFNALTTLLQKNLNPIVIAVVGQDLTHQKTNESFLIENLPVRNMSHIIKEFSPEEEILTHPDLLPHKDMRQKKLTQSSICTYTKKYAHLHMHRKIV